MIDTPLPEVTPDDARTLATLVVRIEDVAVQYFESGLKMEIELQPEDLLVALDRVIDIARGDALRDPDVTNERDVFLHGLVWEIMNEREGIAENKKDAKGKEIFAPLGDESWLKVLVLLRLKSAALIGVEEGT